jgi:Tfp pilus assembly protein PilF
MKWPKSNAPPRSSSCRPKPLPSLHSAGGGRSVDLERHRHQQLGRRSGRARRLGQGQRRQGRSGKALTLDPKALQGSAYTSLAALYDRVPGWPIGFGDSDKAEQLLKQALQLNPDGIDSLYFWGDHLYRQKRYAEAKAALLKALQRRRAGPGNR